MDRFLHTDDRRVLVSIIFPYFLERSEFAKILFVGCDWYTRGYNAIFKDKEYWTLDIAPEQRPFGAENHITDSLENIAWSFREGELDAIICNGVFGWGLNARYQVERAFQGCFQCLRAGGILVLGWNDNPERRPFPPDDCQSLKLFDHHVFPPLSTWQYLTANPNRHIYNFYIKPGNAAPPPSRPV